MGPVWGKGDPPPAVAGACWAGTRSPPTAVPLLRSHGPGQRPALAPAATPLHPQFGSSVERGECHRHYDSVTLSLRGADTR